MSAREEFPLIAALLDETADGEVTPGRIEAETLLGLVDRLRVERDTLTAENAGLTQADTNSTLMIGRLADEIRALSAERDTLTAQVADLRLAIVLAKADELSRANRRARAAATERERAVASYDHAKAEQQGAEQ